jgi:hypothetical protein
VRPSRKQCIRSVKTSRAPHTAVRTAISTFEPLTKAHRMLMNVRCVKMNTQDVKPNIQCALHVNIRCALPVFNFSLGFLLVNKLKKSNNFNGCTEKFETA